MPQATLTFPEVTSTVLPSAANNFAIPGVCSKGIVTQAYTFDPEQVGQVADSIGYGPATEAACLLLRYGRRRVTVFPIAPTTAGVIGSITSPVALGTPIITAASVAASGLVLVAGPYDSLHVALKITAGGAAGTARFKVALDDQTVDGAHVGTYGGEVTVPAAKKAELVGTIDLSLIAGISAALDTLTCIITSDTGGPSTCTFATPANVAAVLSQLNAAWAGEATVELVGASRLAVYSVTAGVLGALTMGAGTANTVLGLTTASTAAGSAATYTIPGVGVALTFPAGTYVADDVYTFDTTAPRHAAGVIDAAVIRVEASIAAGAPLGTVWFTQEDADAIDTRTMVNALSTALTASRARHFSLWGLYQTAKSDTDANVITRLGTFEDRYVTLSGRDCRISGGALTGSRFHRPSSWIGAIKAARDRFSSDLGNHADGDLGTEIGLTSIGTDERTATTKLATFRTAQTGSGGGFLVLESTTSGDVFFYQGRTMAPAGSIYGDLAAVRILLAGARQLQSDLDREVNNDLLVKASGALAESEIDRLVNIFTTGLNGVFFDDPDAPNGHVSALAVSDPTYTVATKTLAATFQIQRRPPAKAVTATVSVTDTLATAEA